MLDPLAYSIRLSCTVASIEYHIHFIISEEKVHMHYKQRFSYLLGIVSIPIKWEKEHLLKSGKLLFIGQNDFWGVFLVVLSSIL